MDSSVLGYFSWLPEALVWSLFPITLAGVCTRVKLSSLKDRPPLHQHCLAQRGNTQMEEMPPYQISGHPSVSRRHFWGYRGHAYKCGKIGRPWLWVISSPGFFTLLRILLESCLWVILSDCAVTMTLLPEYPPGFLSRGPRHGRSLVLHCPPVSD